MLVFKYIEIRRRYRNLRVDSLMADLNFINGTLRFIKYIFT